MFIVTEYAALTGPIILRYWEPYHGCVISISVYRKKCVIKGLHCIVGQFVASHIELSHFGDLTSRDSTFLKSGPGSG